MQRVCYERLSGKGAGKWSSLICIGYYIFGMHITFTRWDLHKLEIVLALFSAVAWGPDVLHYDSGSFMIGNVEQHTCHRHGGGKWIAVWLQLDQISTTRYPLLQVIAALVSKAGQLSPVLSSSVLLTMACCPALPVSFSTAQQGSCHWAQQMCWHGGPRSSRSGMRYGEGRGPISDSE